MDADLIGVRACQWTVPEAILTRQHEQVHFILTAIGKPNISWVVSTSCLGGGIGRRKGPGRPLTTKLRPKSSGSTATRARSARAPRTCSPRSMRSAPRARKSIVSTSMPRSRATRTCASPPTRNAAARASARYHAWRKDGLAHAGDPRDRRRQGEGFRKAVAGTCQPLRLLPRRHRCARRRIRWARRRKASWPRPATCCRSPTTSTASSPTASCRSRPSP